ncbi:MAG: ATPase, partial [Marivirga sp.]|nr:ATPase [Marivirga sp.]
MSNKNFNITFVVDQSAAEVFNAVNSISKWWTENVNGNSMALNDEFTVQFEDIHFSKQRL